MQQKYNVGVIGYGFVGKAVADNFSNTFNVHVWDIDPEKRTIPICADLINWSDIIFVCVPTPSKEDGSCDTTAVDITVKNIASYNKEKVVVIKSTVPPGTTRRLITETGMKRIAFNPEFLTQRNHINDFKNQDTIVIGADDEGADRAVTDLYLQWLDSIHRQCNILHTKSQEAEMFKYVANSFLATKVVFMNEIRELCFMADIDYSQVAYLGRNDKRLGHTHWDVPGPDGQYGYGGACFPKDVLALLKYAEVEDVELSVLNAAQHKNKFLRF